MNIKTVLPQINPLDTRLRLERTGATKYQETSDRDADGRRDDPQQELKRHLSEEELQGAIESLKAMPGISQHNLTVRVEQNDDHRVIFIEDPQGQVVRRLSESELWFAVQEKVKSTGKILDRAG